MSNKLIYCIHVTMCLSYTKCEASTKNIEVFDIRHKNLPVWPGHNRLNWQKKSCTLEQLKFTAIVALLKAQVSLQ